MTVYLTLDELVEAHKEELANPDFRVYQVHHGDYQCFVPAKSKGQAALAVASVEIVSKTELYHATIRALAKRAKQEDGK